MSKHFGRIRRFRFNLPQRIAAVFLALFLAQGFWLMLRSQPGSAPCGTALWLHPFHSAESLSACGSQPHSLLAERLAIFSPAPGLPFLALGCVLGGALWWVTRRQYGNRGGYTALAFYCFSPVTLRAATHPGAEIPAALAVYAGIYTLIGVSHAMQGPRRKWRPRIVLLSVILAAAASTSALALLLAIVPGLAFMLWVAEERRRPIFPVIALVTGAASVGAFICGNFSLTAFTALAAIRPEFCFREALLSLCTVEQTGFSIALVAALGLWLRSQRTRYFGNTAPLICALLMLPLALHGQENAFGSPWLCALPFLFTFIGGVFADGYEGRHGRLWKLGALTLLLTQATVSIYGLLFA